MSTSRKKVIIIGAGLAGLSSAYELSKAGHEVVVLEAQGRPGGRVETQEFSDGLFAEVGAYFIPDKHVMTQKYLSEFNLEQVGVLPKGVPLWNYSKGKRIPISETGEGPWSDLWPDLLPGTKFWDILGNHVWSKLGDLGADPANLDFSDPKIQQYDNMSFMDFLRKQDSPPSDGAIALIRLWYGGWWGDLDKVSALCVLRDSVLGMNGDFKWSTIKNGVDALPQAFVSRLKGKIRYNAPVVAIRQEKKSVKVTYGGSGKRKSASGNYLICAIPFSCLRRIKDRPTFSQEKEAAIEQLSNVSITRVSVQAKERVWGDPPSNGVTLTDIPIMNLIDVSFAQPGRRGILQAYITGPNSQTVRNLRKNDRVPYVVGQMEIVYPGITRSYERGNSKCWDEDEWSQGAFAYFKKGEMSKFVPHIALPEGEGRIHFAGDHTSAWPGWMQGALQSGVDAANAVMQAH